MSNVNYQEAVRRNEVTNYSLPVRQMLNLVNHACNKLYAVDKDTKVVDTYVYTDVQTMCDKKPVRLGNGKDFKMNFNKEYVINSQVLSIDKSAFLYITWTNSKKKFEIVVDGDKELVSKLLNTNIQSNVILSTNDIKEIREWFSNL